MLVIKTIRWLLLVMATLGVGTVAPWQDAAAAETTALDRIWSYATLYENPDNRYLQKFALTGRLQADSAWVDADQGEFDDLFTWRRFRFGFKAGLFEDWTLHIEADFDLNESLGGYVYASHGCKYRVVSDRESGPQVPQTVRRLHARWCDLVNEAAHHAAQ